MSTQNPIEVAAGTVDTNKTNGGITQTLLDALKARVAIALSKTETLGNYDFSAGSPPNAVIYGQTGFVYFYNADDTTSPDDGSTVLVSADGRRYILADMSAIAVSSVLAMTNTPPGSPTDGDAYVVDTSPTGAWAGHAKNIALYTPRGWVFAAAKVGTALLNQQTGLNIQYSAAGSWVSMPTSIASSGVTPFQMLFPMGLSVEAQQNAPPGSPTPGDGKYYLVGTSPSGAWSGKANNLATYDATSTWVFLAPYDGAEIWNKSSSAQLIWSSSAGIWQPPSPIASIAQGRLTLVSGTPVPTTDQTAKATLYFTPWKGNAIALYVNGAWAMRTFTEVSLSLTGYTSGKPFDIFGYDNSGSLALESLVWTDDLNRATALTTQDGVYVKSGDATRKYLGTIYTTATGQTEDSLAKRNVFSYYNRVAKPMLVRDNNGWTYNSGSYRQARGSSANQLEFVIGASQDMVEAAAGALVTGGSASFVSNFSIGLDSTSTPATEAVNAQWVNLSVTATLFASYRAFIATGRHKLVWLENTTGGGTITINANSGAISGTIWC